MHRVLMAAALIFLVLMAGQPCAAADLPVTGKLSQKANVDLDTHIGGVVFTVKRTSPLPNAFGKKDIFGRKVDRGFLELRFKGIAQDGRVVFHLIDVETFSNETTATRTRTDYTQTTARGNATGVSVGNSTYTNGTATASSFTIRGQEGRTEPLPPNTTEFAVDTNTRKEVKIGEVTVVILQSDDFSLKYRLLWSPEKK